MTNDTAMSMRSRALSLSRSSNCGSSRPSGEPSESTGALPPRTGRSARTGPPAGVLFPPGAGSAASTVSDSTSLRSPDSPEQPACPSGWRRQRQACTKRRAGREGAGSAPRCGFSSSCSRQAHPDPRTRIETGGPRRASRPESPGALSSCGAPDCPAAGRIPSACRAILPVILRTASAPLNDLSVGGAQPGDPEPLRRGG